MLGAIRRLRFIGDLGVLYVLVLIGLVQGKQSLCMVYISPRHFPFSACEATNVIMNPVAASTAFRGLLINIEWDHCFSWKRVRQCFRGAYPT